jgi:hypothetical protein
VNNACNPGTNSYLRATPATDFNGDASFSVAFWFLLDTASGTPTLVCYSGAVSLAASGLAWCVDYDVGNTQMRLRTSDGSSFYECNSTFGAISLATWYFCFAYYDSVAGETGISINDGTVDTLGSVPSINQSLDSVGNFLLTAYALHNFSGYNADGGIDELGFWNRVLNSAEVTALYNGGSGITYTDL